MKPWLLTNKGKVGAFLSAIYVYLLFDPNVLQLMTQYPWLNTVVSAITFGLMSAGWLRSDKEQKALHFLKNMKEEVNLEDENA